MTSTGDKVATAAARGLQARRHGWIARRKPLRHYLEAYAFLGLSILAFVFFSVWPETSDTFPTAANLQVLVGANAVVAIVALAALVPLVTNEWDLSVGAIAGLASIYVARLLSDGTPIILTILAGVAIGIGVGILNAGLVTRMGVNAVITTLGVSIILAGIISVETSGQAITGGIPRSFTDFGTRNWIGIPRTAFALAGVALVVYYLLNHTPHGRHLYAIGSNRSAARLVGLRTKLIVALAFVVAGGLAGAGGVLQVARAGGADPRLGNGLTLPALAAAFLSAAAIRPGRYNVVGTVLAVYFLAVLNSGLNLAGAEDYVASFVNGGALIVGVGLAVRLGRRQTI